MKYSGKASTVRGLQPGEHECLIEEIGRLEDVIASQRAEILALKAEIESYNRRFESEYE